MFTSCSNTTVFSIAKKKKSLIFTNIEQYIRLLQSTANIVCSIVVDLNSVYLPVLKALSNKGIPVITNTYTLMLSYKYKH